MNATKKVTQETTNQIKAKYHQYWDVLTWEQYTKLINQCSNWDELEAAVEQIELNKAGKQ